MDTTKYKHSLIIAAVVLVFFNILSKLSGFLREIVMAYYYGAGVVTDAYATAILMTTVLFTSITSAITVTYTPICSKQQGNQSFLNRFTSIVLNFFALLVFCLSLLAVVFVNKLTGMFIRGDNIELHEAAVQMAVIILPFATLWVIYYVLDAYLHSRNFFWHIGVLGVISNLILIVSIPLSLANVKILPYGYIFSVFVSVTTVVFLSYYHRYRYQPVLNPRGTPFRELILLTLPVFAGTFVNQLHEIVDRNFASFMGVGIISAANYATKLNLLFATLIIGSVATILFPTLSRQSTGENLAEFRKTSAAAYSFVGFVMLPIAAWLALFSQELVTIIFQRGAFDEAATIMTSALLLGYIIGLPFLSLNQIINYQFYALGDTRTPVACSMVSVGVNIIMTAVLALTIGYIGIAIGTSIGNIFLTILLINRLNKRGNILDAGAILRPLAKSLLSSGIMIVAMISSKVFLKPMMDSGFVLLLSCTLIGGVVYLVASTVLKAEEIRFTVDQLRNFLKRKKNEKRF